MTMEPDFVRWLQERGIDVSGPTASPTGFVASDMRLGAPTVMPDASTISVDNFGKGQLPNTPASESYPSPQQQASELDYRDFLGAALAQMPDFQGRAYESPLAAGIRGGIQGLASGYGSASRLRREQADKTAAEQARADRDYRLALSDWAKRKGLTTGRDGRVLVRQEDVQQYDIPEAFVGTYQPPSVFKKAEPPEQRIQRIEAEAEARARGSRRGAPPVGRGASTPATKPDDLRWTPAGANAIKQAEAVLAAARKAMLRDGSGGEQAVRDAEAALDDARKRDFAAQMRTAKTLREVNRLSEKVLALYPEWADSPMVRQVTGDALDALGSGNPRR